MRYGKLESSGTYQDQTSVFAGQRAAGLAVATPAAVEICTICHYCGMMVEGGDENLRGTPSNQLPTLQRLDSVYTMEPFVVADGGTQLRSWTPSVRLPPAPFSSLPYDLGIHEMSLLLNAFKMSRKGRMGVFRNRIFSNAGETNRRLQLMPESRALASASPSRRPDASSLESRRLYVGGFHACVGKIATEKM